MQPQTKTAAPKKTRGPSRHVWSYSRRAQPRYFRRSPGYTAFDRALSAAFPWSPDDYPGLTRGAVELLGNKVADRTIRNWRQGTRYQPPLWAIEIVQAFLRRRAEHELACVEELEKEKAARSFTP